MPFQLFDVPEQVGTALVRRVTAALLPLALAGGGCYTYTPLATPDPVPGTRVSLVLSDQGRVGMGPRIGQGVARVDGAIVGASATHPLGQVFGADTTTIGQANLPANMNGSGAALMVRQGALAVLAPLSLVILVALAW